MTSDPYAVLGVSRTASLTEIRAAWTTRINAAAGAGNLGLAKQIDAAYELLCDSFRRAHYDSTGTIIEAQRLAPDPIASGPVRDWTATLSAADVDARRGVGRYTDPMSTTRTRRRPRMRQPTVMLLVLVVLIAGGIFAFENHKVPNSKLFAKPLGPTVVGQSFISEEDSPTIHAIKPSPRPLAPATAPAGSGGYKLLNSARWDPCQPIHYIVNGNPPIPNVDTLLTQAIAEVSRDTGLTFVNDGPTFEPPRLDRPAFEPTVYGNRWAPVLIAWTDPQHISQLAGSTTGLGGPTSFTIQGHEQDVTGMVYFDTVQLLHALYVKDGRQVIRTTILHELGHLVGLAHVRDKSSVMYPESRPHGPTTYSPGDLRGLAYLGDGRCLPWTTS